ncbi:ATP-binding protein [Actinospica durhamensis]|uniref:ATP-binding protein n=1 Tax=Actinospica durhamensis TaxID=1508375 RepID=A0A941ELQ9_9ACTN|nr:ATP-binding protein [Actinospica durhamensis]MBR7833260.1 ATP-binding protein [Actinospica durhamensis]
MTGDGELQDPRIDGIPEDLRNAGPRSRAGFTYQDECAALALLGHLGHRDLEGIVVERSTDLILLPREPARPELVSVKHREANQSSDSRWGWSDLKKERVLADLHAKWNAAGRSCTVAFWSNAGFSDATHELWLSCTKQRTASPKLIARIQEHIGESNPDEALEFLAALRLPLEPLPRRAEITDVGIRRTVDLLKEHRPRSAEAAPRCYERLLTLLHYASNESRSPLQPVAAAGATLAAAHEFRAAMRSRKTYLARETIVRELVATCDRLEAQLLPDVGWHMWEEDDQFTGRDEYVLRLDALLEPGNPVPVSPVVIHGVTGSGKTSLATHYAASRAASFRPIFINGATRAGVIRSLVQLAGGGDNDAWNDELARAAGPVTAKLPGNCATLIVIDGVDDVTLLRGIVSRKSLCRVLITTTRGHLDQGYEHVELGPWSIGDASRFVESVLPASLPDLRDRLVRVLGGHPLALTQAVNYCQATRRPIEHFLRKLTTKPLDALGLGSASGHPEPVVQSVALNIEAAREREPAAFELLGLLAYMSADPFDETLLGSHGGHAYVYVASDGLEPTEPSASATAIRRAVRDEDALEEAANTLVGMSLAERRDTGLVVHPLVALITRGLGGDPQPWLEVGLAPFIDLLNKDAAELDERAERHLSHALRLAEHAMSAGLFGPAVALTCINLAQYLSIHGSWGAGLVGISGTPSQFTDRVTRVFWDRALAGQLQWQLAFQLRIIHACVLYRDNLKQDAEDVLFDVINEAGLRGDANAHLRALLTVSSLVITADPARRSELVLMQLERIPEALATQSPWTIASIAHIKTEALIRLGRIEEAEAVNRDALARARNADIPEATRAELHSDAVSLARYAGNAQALLEQAKAVYEIRKRNSHDRPNWLLIDGLQQYADAAIDAQEFQLAEQRITEAEELTREYFTTDCAQYAKVLGIRGRLHLVTLRLTAAEADLSRAATILRGGSEEDEQHLPAVLVHLALVTASSGRRPEALELIDEAIALDTYIYGEQHPETQFDIEVREIIQRGASIDPPALWSTTPSAQGLSWVFQRLTRPVEG